MFKGASGPALSRTTAAWRKKSEDTGNDQQIWKPLHMGLLMQADAAPCIDNNVVSGFTESLKTRNAH